MFVLCDCPITLAILDMEALRAGKEAIVQSASRMGKPTKRVCQTPKMIGFSPVVIFFNRIRISETL